MAESIIEVADLHKRFGGVEALAGLTLSVPRGAICGFLGRNGAGKTTTIRVLLGMLRPTSGAASVLGLAVDRPDASVEIRARTAFVSEERELYDAMTVAALVRLIARFYPRWRADLERDYLRRFELPLDRAVRHLSRGMRTKLAWLLALCSGAELLLLDEPTAGLDPVATEELLKTLVSHAANEGVTALLSTHQLSDVEQVADHVAIIERGRAVLDGPLDELRARYKRVQIVFEDAAPEHRFDPANVVATRREGRVLTALARAGADRVVAEARALGPTSIDVLPVTLKEIFLETVAGGNANALV